MMSSPTCDRVAKDDRTAILELDRPEIRASGAPASTYFGRIFDAWCENENGTFIKLVESGVPIACAYGLVTRAGELMIEGLRVAPHARGRRLVQRLCLELSLRHRTARHALFVVGSDNIPMLKVVRNRWDAKEVIAFASVARQTFRKLDFGSTLGVVDKTGADLDAALQSPMMSPFTFEEWAVETISASELASLARSGELYGTRNGERLTSLVHIRNNEPLIRANSIQCTLLWASSEVAISDAIYGLRQKGGQSSRTVFLHCIARIPEMPAVAMHGFEGSRWSQDIVFRVPVSKFESDV